MATKRTDIIKAAVAKDMESRPSLRESTEGAQIEHRASTGRAQKRADYGKFKPTELVHFSIRLRAGDLAALGKHFESLDVPVGQGIRQILVSYIKGHGLR